MKRFAALVMCILCLFQTALAETSAWTCLDCGDEEQGYAFCVFCGAERPKECPACGWKTAIRGACFCGRCGGRLVSGKASYGHLAEAKIGDVVELGHYEQDGDESNGREPIKWVVMDVQKDKILLLAVNVLDVQPYDESGKADHWLKSSLRTWMNTDFRDAAFTALEQELLMPGKPYNNSHFAEDDQLFLLAYDSNICDIDYLSLGAVFIPSNHDRKYLGTGIENFELAPPTEYALSRSIRACDYYWEHGGTTKMNMPTGDGCFYHQEMTELYGVRPACWLSLEALEN